VRNLAFLWYRKETLPKKSGGCMFSGWSFPFFASAVDVSPFGTCNEFKSVNAILIKLRAKPAEWQAEIDKIESSDIYKKQMEIAKYKNTQEESDLSRALILLKDKKAIIDKLLQQIDVLIEIFYNQKKNVFYLAALLDATLSNISDYDKNTLNRMRNDYVIYGYYGKRAAVVVAGATLAVAASPSTLIAVPAAVGGGYVANKVDSKIRDQYEDEYLDTASAQLLNDLIKSVNAVLKEQQSLRPSHSPSSGHRAD
jgi:hypothetical protein